MLELPRIKTKEELTVLIEDIGFIPLCRGAIPGFSVEDITEEECWFNDDSEHDPWDWRKRIAEEGKIAYGKLFQKKAGFISKVWYPKFANFRRDGYNFDSLFEEGLAPRRNSAVMKVLEAGALPSYEIKRRAGFGKGGEKGFEGVLTALQMQTYIIVAGFEQKRNKAGEPYGWSTGVYSTSEALYGAEFVRSEYNKDPKQSRDEIAEQFLKLFGEEHKDGIIKLLG